jgi:hypothetical protein
LQGVHARSKLNLNIFRCHFLPEFFPIHFRKELCMSDSDNRNGQDSDKNSGKETRPVMFCQTAARPDKTTGEGQAPSTPRRRRKEKRRMSALMFFRCTPEERITITSRAGDVGLEPSSYLRVQALGTSKLRRYRRIRADWDELRRCMGVINKAGNVVNQLVVMLRVIGSGGTEAASLALAELSAAARAIVEALKESR